MLVGNLDLNTQYDFTMCNPPFFDSDNNNGPKSRTSNRTEPTCPKSGGSNAASEIAVKGGEVQFVQKLLQESKDIKSAVRYFKWIMIINLQVATQIFFFTTFTCILTI